MSDHVTKQLRNKYQTALNTIPAVADRVFKSRLWKFNGDELPAINIMSGPETIESEVARMSQPQIQKREIRTMVTIIEKATDDLDDKLDDIKLLVENKILSNPGFDGLAEKTFLERVETGGVPGMETEFGVMAMVFVSIIRTREGIAQTKLGG